MRGIVFTSAGVEVTDDLEVRDPGPKEVRVRIGAAGVCHSDLSVIDGTIPFPPPVVLGHEGAGVVEAVGSEVRSVKPGDHVVIATLASCGTCRACSTGHPTWCRSSLGNIGQPFTYKGEPAHNFAAASVFAEMTVVSEVQAVRIPADVPLTSACLIGCGVLTGVGAVLNRAGVRPGRDGCGLRRGRGGPQRDPGPADLRAPPGSSPSTRWRPRRTWAVSSGPPTSSTPPVGDAAAAVRALVPPDRERAAGALNPTGGVTWAFDCVGHPAVLRSALDALDWGGTAVAIGIPPRGTEVPVDVNALAYVDRGLLGLSLRVGATPPRHPPHGRPLPVRAAPARRTGQPHPAPGRVLRGGRRDARRAGRPGRAHLRGVSHQGEPNRTGSHLLGLPG